MRVDSNNLNEVIKYAIFHKNMNYLICSFRWSLSNKKTTEIAKLRDTVFQLLLFYTDNNPNPLLVSDPRSRQKNHL